MQLALTAAGRQCHLLQPYVLADQRVERPQGDGEAPQISGGQVLA